MKYLSRIALVIPLAVLLGGCALPFSFNTETATISIPISALITSDFQDTAATIPPDAVQEGLTYSLIRLHYRVTTDSSLEANVVLYVSSDETPDGDSTGDELLIDADLSAGETITGWVETEKLRDALNAKNSQFVVGGFAESLLGTGTVTIEMYAEIAGTYEVGP